MAPEYAVSVVLGTHNRAPLLGPAISRLLDQTPTSPDYELIVVDNNSTDDTRAVVEEYARHATRPIRYIFEGRQGLSYARNAGIAAALAPIVAFTDDDVRVSRDWVEVIRNTFDQHPDVSCLGGRTLPVWPSRPPRWLTPLHWVGPLALQDYGERSFIVDSRRPVCLAGANFAFRKTVFDRVGLFSTDFPRAQDTEFLLRMYRAKERSLYVPRMRADATVDPGRLTKAYHRRWHLNIGRCNARMGFEELADPLLGLRESAPHFARAFGVPVFAFRQLGRELCAWVWMAIRGRPGEAFLHETRMRSLAGYILESRAIRRRENTAVEAAPAPKEERAVAHARSEV